MSEPEPSLIQQRIALDRKRGWGLYGIVMPVVGMVFAIALMFTGTLPWLYAISALAFLAMAVVNVFRLRDALREKRAFEAEYGVDAGRRD